MSAPAFVLAMLCLFTAVSEWLVRRTWLRHLATALLVILVTALAANLGTLPAGSTAAAPVPVYDAIFANVAPLGIFRLLLRVSLRDILRAGHRRQHQLQRDYARVRVMHEGGLYAGAVAVDNVVTTAWMAATIALPRLLGAALARRSTTQFPGGGPARSITPGGESRNPSRHRLGCLPAAPLLELIAS